MMVNRHIRLSRSIVGQPEAEAVSRLLIEDGYLGMGKEVKAFEEDIAQFLHVPRERVICVNSGTAALHLAVQAITKPGDKILVQSLTFLSSFQAISAAGAIPIPCEVDRDTLTLDIEDAKRRLTHDTCAVMPVHYASNPGHLDDIYAFAARNKLRVIEDAAHAFGCTYNNRSIGTFGDIICFSFDGIKNITSGEGGAVISSDEGIQGQIRDARLLGVQKDTEKRFSGERSWEFEVTHQGYRYHMSNIFAAIGRVQLRRFEKEFKPKRIEIARRYRSVFSQLKDVTLLESNLQEIVPHIFPIRVLQGKRDSLRKFLANKGIESGVHYKPNHLLSFYGAQKGSLPVTEGLYEELLTLPLHPGLTDDDVEYIIEIVRGHFAQ
jgi:dTDP-4-amino-4,6-dideoxygalactose transaminase